MQRGKRGGGGCASGQRAATYSGDVGLGGGGVGGWLQVIGYGSNRYRLTDKDCNLKRPFYCAKKI